ncbi:MAG: ribonuclease HI [Nitrospinaceae bacterium]|nr:ribonuclease HI [Nitrospinaceae bacterium]NIR54952.1 ribonuclease HI [Nitrospinaceae bacterium]NIS85370.1 ribonuclease HI [Nitrospinaceae bacterium]NIT82194.1 ribonuclease HI [Nitrospinaceae bacterium]NIU44438.1 ribonuclease HI [Nitrospinaceae bacterium]
MKKVKIFTDGCCKGNPGPGGYGAIIKYNNSVKEYKGAVKQTTNNIMELTAAIIALNQLQEPCEVELTTDSQYLVKGMTQWVEGWVRKGWINASKQPVKNRTLWEELQRLSRIHKISWKWIRGHAGHPENERCDALANEAMADLKP